MAAHLNSLYTAEDIFDMSKLNKENIPPNAHHALIRKQPSKPAANDSFIKRTHSMDVHLKQQPQVLGNHMMNVEPIENFPLSRPGQGMDLEEPVQSDIDKFDRLNKHNPQMVSVFVRHIFDYLREREDIYLPRDGYMTNQSDINEKMRAILIDWLVDVNVKFRLVPETLFLTVNIVDRYLAKTRVGRHKLQLVGVSALLIACKYEEIYPPSLKEFVAICDRAYTSNEILDMEAHILLSLDFEMTHTSSLRFLERYT